MLATQGGVSGTEKTPIFPIQIFKVKSGVNFLPGDPNYDLYRLVLETTARRLFPNFVRFSIQAVQQSLRPGKRSGKRSLLHGLPDVRDGKRERGGNRDRPGGNLSFTTVNLDANSPFCPQVRKSLTAGLTKRWTWRYVPAS
ncbi:anaerobic ribonucleoside-triphosphate reductase [Paenibacillus sp. JTLBN-2024]